MTLWLFGQAGIGLEVLGLLWVMYRAFRSEKEIGDLSNLHTYEGLGKLEAVGRELSGQFKKQWPGFALVVVGLIGQWVGNFANLPL